MATFNFGNCLLSQYILATGTVTYLMSSAMQCGCVWVCVCGCVWVCGGVCVCVYERQRQIKGKRRQDCFHIFIFKVTDCVEETQSRNGKKL